MYAPESMHPPSFRCIYSSLTPDCFGLLDDTTAPAHVIMAAIGGRISSKITVCTLCNSAIGREAEEILVADFDILRNLLNIQKTQGRQRQPPALRRVDSPIGTIDILPGGRASQAPKVTLQPDEEGAFTIEGTDLQQVVRRLMHLLRERGISPAADIRAYLRLCQSSHEMRPQQTMLKGSMGGDAQRRAVAKIGFEFLALCRQADIYDDRLDPVRRFVRLGEPSDCTAWDAQNQPTLPFHADELGPAYHSIAVWAAAKSTPLIAAVTLFGVLHWTVELAPAWWNGPFGVAHAVNPLAGRNLGNRDMTPRLVAQGWKAARSIDPEAVAAGMSKLLQHWQDEQRKQAVKAAVERLMTEIADGSDTLDGEQVQLLFSRAADWAAHYYVGMPWQTSLDMEQIIRQVEQEYPAFCAALNRC